MKGRGDEGGMLGGWIDKSKGTEMARREGALGREQERSGGVIKGGET